MLLEAILSLSLLPVAGHEASSLPRCCGSNVATHSFSIGAGDLGFSQPCGPR